MNFIQDLKIFWNSLLTFLGSVINLKDDTDVNGTIESTRKGVALSGGNIWILIASSIIASVGLDMNSQAVIIGAMLISPLMAPILGLGLSVGINDKRLFFDSLQNMSVAVIISLISSYLYFVITPFGELTNEMLSRTSPISTDAIIAFAGGIAGIVAGTRMEKSNALPGAAIATALMPPLCVAGFGLATGDFDVFIGAFYLFFLNAVFIGLATYLIVRLLRFPYVAQINPKEQSKVKTIFFICLAIVVVPSVITMVRMLQADHKKSDVKAFISEEIKHRMPGIFHNDYKIEFLEESDSVLIELVVLADKEVNQTKINFLNKTLKDNYNIDKGRVVVYQNDHSKLNQMLEEFKKENDFIAKNSYERTQQELEFYKARTAELEDQIGVIKRNYIPVLQIIEEIKLNSSDIKDVKYAEIIDADENQKMDTLSTFFLGWQQSISDQKKIIEVDRLNRWLKVRLSKDSVVLKDW